MGLDARWVELPAVQRRFLLFTAGVGLVFLLLVLRLWYLQVISYDTYQERSVRNRTRVLQLEAPRGPIFDRGEALLVDNRPLFQISVMRQDVTDREALLGRLAALLEVDQAQLEQRWQDGLRFPIYRPVPLATDVSREMLERVQEQGIDLPGVLTEVRPVRDYLDRGSAAHLIGYLGEITEDELATGQFEYQPGDYVGKTAIEREYENYLKGTKGKRLVEVDVKGKLLRQLQMEPAKPGNKLYLTLDRDLQAAADEAFGDQSGAAIALDVHTGDILAMVSRPTFDPAMFARGITGEEWKDLLQDKRNPLQNKVIAGQYSPASTFKTIVALAAMREGLITTNRTINCRGDFELAGARFRCWKKDGHGPTNLHKALRESCDVWFYQVGLELGIDKLSAAAKEFGLGEVVGYPLPGEKPGVVPSQEWKRDRLHQPWYAGETVISSIGQGYVLVTPIQLAVMTAAIANEGKVLQPKLIRKIENWRGQVLLEPQTQVVREITYPAPVWQAIKSGLVGVVNEPSGTGQVARLNGVLVAGKTGTSQVVKRKSDEEEEQQATPGDVPYLLRPHALFVAFAPADDPQIAVAVVVEHGEHGGSAAGPIAKAILERYFALQKKAAVVEK